LSAPIPALPKRQKSGFGRLLLVLAVVWLAAILFESFGWIGATIVTLVILFTHL
jgi:hypothetical protein